jgi:hypothetical protein
MCGLQARRSSAYASVRRCLLNDGDQVPPALSVHRQTTAVENLAESAVKKYANSTRITVVFVTAFWCGHEWTMDKEED